MLFQENSLTILFKNQSSLHIWPIFFILIICLRELKKCYYLKLAFSIKLPYILWLGLIVNISINLENSRNWWKGVKTQENIRGQDLKDVQAASREAEMACSLHLFQVNWQEFRTSLEPNSSECNFYLQVSQLLHILLYCKRAAPLAALCHFDEQCFVLTFLSFGLSSQFGFQNSKVWTENNATWQGVWNGR